MTFSIGNRVRLTVFGSSHGDSVGAILDGLPHGIIVDMDNIRKWLDYRRPGQSDITTQRHESDEFQILSGIFEGKTDGSPLCIRIPNSDAISKHYDDLRHLPRPGHADLTMFYKYGEDRNYPGGGFFSGRMTAPIVAVGAVCMQILENMGIRVVSWQSSIGNVAIEGNSHDCDPHYCYRFKTRIPDQDKDRQAQQLIKDIMGEGNSVGGIISTNITGIPPGVGEPFFDSVESAISHMAFSIPGLKGIEFGSGFRLGKMSGFEAMDEFFISDGVIKTMKNNNGGILGGITNGMPIFFNVVMKPTSSVRKEMKTVDIDTMEESMLKVQGRHDPCISIRAVPVVQTSTAIVLCDLLSAGGFLKT